MGRSLDPSIPDKKGIWNRGIVGSSDRRSGSRPKNSAERSSIQANTRAYTRIKTASCRTTPSTRRRGSASHRSTASTTGGGASRYVGRLRGFEIGGGVDIGGGRGGGVGSEESSSEDEDTLQGAVSLGGGRSAADADELLDVLPDPHAVTDDLSDADSMKSVAIGRMRDALA